jgi:hypothetical protein
MKGGYISSDSATIIINNRKPYNFKVLCYNGDGASYTKNIAKLRELDLLEE